MKHINESRFGGKNTKEREAMMMLNRIVFVSLAMVAAAATAAPAATKYSANLVSNSATDPPPNPTL